MNLTQVSIGFFAGIFIAGLSWRLRALSRSGAIAAALSGGLIFALGGLPWAALLMTFFISSSLLSRLFPVRKRDLNEKFSKAGQRDWAQVLANSGLGVVLVLVTTLSPEQKWPWVAYASAIAAVNADTWATELGVMSRLPPRLITNWRSVERGTSGGISIWGSASALAGAVVVAVAALIFSSDYNQSRLLISIIFAGLCGSFFDSVLGATVQSIYWCSACMKETERHPTHFCGASTTPLRGWRWLDNDWVNFLASLFGSLAGLLLFLL